VETTSVESKPSHEDEEQVRTRTTELVSFCNVIEKTCSVGSLHAPTNRVAEATNTSAILGRSRLRKVNFFH
jgi:hypothetical protein